MLILAGLYAGIIHTLAGCGSLITLLIFMLLFGPLAEEVNGTHRIEALTSTGKDFLAYRL